LLSRRGALRVRGADVKLGGKGFPDGHPAVQSVLAVTISSRDTVYGWLYFAERRGADEFSEEDERLALVLARQLALLYESSVHYDLIQRHAAQLQIEALERRRAEQKTRDYAAQLQGLSRRLVEVEESERRNLNRELHDRVGQNLAALNINLNIVRSRIPQRSLRAVGDRLDDTQRLLEETSGHIRNVMADLHPPALDEYGLRAALVTYAKTFGARLSTPILVRGEDLAPRPPFAAEMALFRVAQGALANAIAHARATRIEITLAALADRVTLTIADDGSGFDATRPRPGRASWGLAIMRERAEAVGATLRIDSAPARGTRVVVEMARSPA
jgi:signal transduction histidine kinase